MFYSIRHVTRFQYSAPVSESNMEVRMRPRSEGRQRCLKFDLHVTPKAKVSQYRDHMGNTVHYFDIPPHHTKLTLVAESIVDVDDPEELPAALPLSAWETVDATFAGGEHWEMQNPSSFAVYSEKLCRLAEEFRLDRSNDPLTTLRRVNTGIFQRFEYMPKSTRVDSPIDEALTTGRGVCQDFTHIMIALVRQMKIPARYVSGYLYPHTVLEERSALGATHAWMEAFLPEFGWVGFDPTNDELCSNRHITTAVGRDYADVPPTKGVFKGRASSELSVAVRVAPTDAPSDERDDFHLVGMAIADAQHLADAAWDVQQQQQQQQ